MTDARLAGLPEVAMAARAAVASNSAAVASSRDARDEPFYYELRKRDREPNETSCYWLCKKKLQYSRATFKKAKGSRPGGTKDAHVGHVCQRGAHTNP